MPVEIRRLTELDTWGASAIVRKNYDEATTRVAIDKMALSFQESMVSPKFFSAVLEETVVGFGGYVKSWMATGVYEIFLINVDPDHHGLGIGKRIVNHIIDEIRTEPDSVQVLLTAKDKLPEFYANNFGFKRIRIIEKPKRAIMMLTL